MLLRGQSHRIHPLKISYVLTPPCNKPEKLDISYLILPVALDFCNMIIPKSNSCHEFTNKVDELRALPGHVLGAARVQVPEDDLNDLKWTWEEDREVETLDLQF
ncbi:hypothetical protein Tco_0288124, partial [Tanacetum coccineum]